MVEQRELPFPADVEGIPDTFAGALQSMVDKPWLDSQGWQKQQWRANREGVHPDLLRFEPLLVRRMARLGVPMYCAEAVRSAERQADLYAHGVTKIKHGGPHQFGCAMDIVHGTKAWSLTRKQWAVIGHVGKEAAKAAGLRLTWGGDWSFYDPAHWEVDAYQTVTGGFPFPKRS